MSALIDPVHTDVVSGIPQPVSLEDVVISDHLLSRPIHTVPSRVEINAMYELAEFLAQGAPALFKRLALMAIELCHAGSGGISMLESGQDGGPLFRWRALAGALESYEGGSTPRDWSPCGQCLKAAKPMLYLHPARFFTYFQKVNTPIVEGLVIPMYSDRKPIGTIWIVSHVEQRHFDAEDVRIMTSLGAFVSAELRLSLGTRRLPDEARVLVWAELVRRVASGDSSALSALMEETKPVVFARALRLLGLRADAEEVTMDVYSQVWRMAGHYDSRRGGVLAWLLNIARSRAIDLLRSRARQQRCSQSLYAECGSARDLNRYEASSETARQVHRALEALPGEQRQAIELAYLKGYSMTEVASQLGLPLGTAKSRVRYGLMRLRRVMAATESFKLSDCRKIAT